MSPFASLNLRWNPFGEAPECDRWRIAVVDFDMVALAQRLTRQGVAVEFVGLPGRGKSMHLHALSAHFPDAPVIRVGDNRRPVIPDAHVLFVDEPQRLAGDTWTRLLRRRASLVFAAQESHADELTRAHIDCLTIPVGTIPSSDKLRAMVDRRMDWARRRAGPVPEVPVSLLDDLAAQHRDDLRAIEDSLYRYFQKTLTGRAS